MSQKLSLGAFKQATIHHHSSMGCKTVTCQSWSLKKNYCIGFSNPSLLNKSLPPSTLEGHSFATPLAMMMKSTSFESFKPYLLTLNLKNSIAAISTSVRTCWKVPIYYINRVLVILYRTALYIHIAKISTISKDFYWYLRRWKFWFLVAILLTKALKERFQLKMLIKVWGSNPCSKVLLM